MSAARILPLVLLHALAGCSAALRSGSAPWGDAAWPPAPPGTLRVVSYNFFQGNREPRASARALRWLAPDLVALQEVNPKHIAIFEEELSALLPHSFFPGRASGRSVAALLSRFPLHEPGYAPSQHGLNGFAFARVDLGATSLLFVSLHLDPIRTWYASHALTLPWQLARQGCVHRRELEQLWGTVRGDLPVIVAGDLNSFTSREAVEQLTRRGLVDSFAAVTPDAERFATLRFRVFGIPVGGRIDFVFHSRELDTVESAILAGGPSDHDLVVSTLRCGACGAGAAAGDTH